jgi:DNA-binding MarR family transcriptional regulator
METTFDNFTDDTGFLMLQVSNLWKDYYNKALKHAHGLTHMQYVVLTGIYWFSIYDTRKITQTAIAKHTRIDPMTISHVFRGLEAKNFIYRKTHPSDIRAKSVGLTPEGEKLMKQVLDTVTEIDERFFRILGKNSTRFNKFLKLLLDKNN